MVDITNWTELTNRFSGSERKTTLQHDGRIYMVKFPDPIREQNNELSYMNNVFSEDIGCKIYSILGFETQNTFLAKYIKKGIEKIVVVCEDFTQDGERLFEFHKLCLQYLASDSIKTQANIDNIMDVIDNYPRIADKKLVKNRFWDMFIVDGFIGNSDRNLDNWGLLEKNNGELYPAPIYDCGSSLSPLITEKIMLERLHNSASLKQDEFNVYSCYRINGKRILFSDIMKNPPGDLLAAIKRTCPKIKQNMEKISTIVDNTPMLSDVQKKYIKTSLKLRYDLIIKPAIKKNIILCR